MCRRWQSCTFPPNTIYSPFVRQLFFFHLFKSRMENFHYFKLNYKEHALYFLTLFFSYILFWTACLFFIRKFLLGRDVPNREKEKKRVLWEFDFKFKIWERLQILGLHVKNKLSSLLYFSQYIWYLYWTN